MKIVVILAEANKTETETDGRQDISWTLAFGECTLESNWTNRLNRNINSSKLFCLSMYWYCSTPTYNSGFLADVFASVLICVVYSRCVTINESVCLMFSHLIAIIRPTSSICIHIMADESES
jgi:hypothetical protein